MRMASGRTRSIQEAAKASACGARLTTARSPSSGLGNLATFEKVFTIENFVRTLSLENPVLRGRAQLLQAFLAACLRVDAHYGFGSRQPVADPRPVAEHQFQSIGADALTDRMPAELPRIGP